MCSDCDLPVSGDLSTTLKRRTIPFVVLIVGAVLLVVLVPSRPGAGRTGAFDFSDRVFVQDLSAKSSQALELANWVRRSSTNGAVTHATAAFARTETNDLAETSSARDALNLSISGTATGHPAATIQDERAVQALIAHSQDDILLGRIELSGGANMTLRRLARRLLQAHAGELQRLKALSARLRTPARALVRSQSN